MKKETEEKKEKQILCVWGEQNIFNIFFVICVSMGMFLKRVVESSLLSKYDRLNPNIDQVMPV